MSSINHRERLLKTPFEGFANSILPLYSGPQVVIRIGSASGEYVLPKALLCEQSPYFAAMFEGSFEEGESQSATLEEMDGVVSTRSFQILVQWLWLGRVVFGESTPEEAITAAIEFVRLADMCGITGVESFMAEHIREVIRVNIPPANICFEGDRDPQRNTYYLSSQHIASVASLPKGHPVRSMIAMAAVEGYFLQDNFKFLEEAGRLHNFSFDLLQEVKSTLKTLTHGKQHTTVKDPFSGEKLRVGSIKTSGF